jgi:hypothetical protein
MYSKNWNRHGWLTPGICCELHCTADWGDRSHAVGQLAGEPMRHCAPITQAGHVNASLIQIHFSAHVIKQSVDERHVVHTIFTRLTTHTSELTPTATRVP